MPLGFPLILTAEASLANALVRCLENRTESHEISQEICLNDSELTLEYASTSNPAPNDIGHK
jgi:hypothetical protein